MYICLIDLYVPYVINKWVVSIYLVGLVHYYVIGLLKHLKALVRFIRHYCLLNVDGLVVIQDFQVKKPLHY